MEEKRCNLCMRYMGDEYIAGIHSDSPLKFTVSSLLKCARPLCNQKICNICYCSNASINSGVKYFYGDPACIPCCKQLEDEEKPKKELHDLLIKALKIYIKNNGEDKKTHRRFLINRYNQEDEEES